MVGWHKYQRVTIKKNIAEKINDSTIAEDHPLKTNKDHILLETKTLRKMNKPMSNSSQAKESVSI